MARIPTQQILEGNPPWIFGLIGNPATGEPALIADIESIQIKVFQVGSSYKTLLQIGDTIDLEPATVMVDTPITDDLRYDEEDGYNFKYQLPGEFFPAGKTTFVADIRVVPISGLPFLSQWTFKTINTYFYDSAGGTDA